MPKQTNASTHPGSMLCGLIIYLQALSFLDDYEALVLEAQEPFEQPKHNVRSRGTLKAILR
jgi:hypothetical protein